MKTDGAKAARSDGSDKKERFGHLVEFTTVDQLLTAAEQVRDAGYTRWDVHSPFPIHGVERAMGLQYSKLPLFILGCGLTGMAVGFLLQWWMNAIDYPIIVSGKPLLSLPANIPVIFELTVLFSALGAFVGLMVFNRLPQFYHGVFSSPRFLRATSDRFFLSVEASDPKYDREKTGAFLASLGGTAIEELEG